jgi:hypothetical protein
MNLRGIDWNARNGQAQARFKSRVQAPHGPWQGQGLVPVTGTGPSPGHGSQDWKKQSRKSPGRRQAPNGARFLRKEKSFSKAAKQAHISPERLRTYAQERGIIEKRGRRWVIKNDLPRRVLIYADGRERQIVVGDFKAASLVGKYMSAVGWFLTSNDKSYLKPFVGKTVTDIAGKPHALETRPNVLYRLSHAGGSSFEAIYRIVI